jgi:hypothetical protein
MSDLFITQSSALAAIPFFLWASLGEPKAAILFRPAHGSVKKLRAL